MNATLFDWDNTTKNWLNLGEGFVGTVHQGEYWWDIYFRSKENGVVISKLK